MNTQVNNGHERRKHFAASWRKRIGGTPLTEAEAGPDDTEGQAFKVGGTRRGFGHKMRGFAVAVAIGVVGAMTVGALPAGAAAVRTSTGGYATGETNCYNSTPSLVGNVTVNPENGYYSQRINAELWYLTSSGKWYKHPNYIDKTVISGAAYVGVGNNFAFPKLYFAAHQNVRVVYRVWWQRSNGTWSQYSDVEGNYRLSSVNGIPNSDVGHFWKATTFCTM